MNNIKELLQLCAQRCRTTVQLKQQIEIRINTSDFILDETAKQYIEQNKKSFIETLNYITNVLTDIEWNVDNIKHVLKTQEQILNVSAREIFSIVRIVFTGSTISEPIQDLMWILGKEKSLLKLKNFIKFIEI